MLCVGLLAAMLIAGCGSVAHPAVSSAPVPAPLRAQTATRAHTTTSRASTTTASPGPQRPRSGTTGSTDTSGSGYSTTVVSKLSQLCLAKVGDASICHCAVHYVEANVPVSELEAAASDLSTGARPSWYYGAVAACL